VIHEIDASFSACADVGTNPASMRTTLESRLAPAVIAILEKRRRGG